MYEFTVSMALVDFLPVIFFAVSAVLMMRDFYYPMHKYGFAMLAAGTVDVFTAGFLKALWKLLYALGICDFQVFNKMFMPTQSLGFLMAGIAMVVLVSNKKSSEKLLVAAAPAVYSGTVMFLIMMVSGLGMMCVSLAVVAKRMKKGSAAILFIASFILSMGMGYAGRLDSTAAWVNWLEQTINIGSQGCLLAGLLILDKAGLRALARK